jgi:hypothetical protein
MARRRDGSTPRVSSWARSKAGRSWRRACGQQLLGPQRLERALVDAGGALVGDQGGGLVVALVLLDLADLEHHRRLAAVVLGHQLDDLGPQLDGLVPLPRLLVQLGQLVGDVGIVGPQGLGLLEHGAGAAGVELLGEQGRARAGARPRPPTHYGRSPSTPTARQRSDLR